MSAECAEHLARTAHANAQRFACSHIYFRTSEMGKNANDLNGVDKVSWQMGPKKLALRVVKRGASVSQNSNTGIFNLKSWKSVQTES